MRPRSWASYQFLEESWRYGRTAAPPPVIGLSTGGSRGDEEMKLPPARHRVRGSRSVPGSQSPFVAAVCPQVTLTRKGLEEYVESGQGEDQVVYQVRPPARKQTQPWASQEDGNRFCFCKATVEGTSPFSRGAHRAASLSVSHVHLPTQG